MASMTSLRETKRRRLKGVAIWSDPLAERPRVTRQDVIRWAIDILHKDGIDGLTMRRLADRMQIKAASLYNHVTGKSELLTLVADAICGELTGSAPGRNWRAELETLAIGFRRVLLAHRDGARVLAATSPTGPNRLRMVERVLGTLVGAGFSAAEATDAAWVHNSYVVGFVLDETLGVPSGAVSLRRWREDQRLWLKSLSSEQYPTLTSLADQLTDVRPDRRFKFGLSSLLDGFELHLANKKR